MLKNKLFICFIILAICPAGMFAHAADQFDNLTKTEVAWVYLKLGFEHILPLGLDHILFVLSLYFLNSNLKSVLWQATTFTVAHSITLGLAAYNIFSPPAHIIEPIIALSIMFVALENVITDKLKPSRLFVVFLFGLIHGLGFAGALSEIGLPKTKFLTSLITFNVGVELGQIAVILIAWLCVGLWFSNKKWYRKRIVYPISIIIAIVAFYWTIERIFFT